MYPVLNLTHFQLKQYQKNVWKVLHHMQGTPQTMQINPRYSNILLDIYDYFENKIEEIKEKCSFKKNYFRSRYWLW